MIKAGKAAPLGVTTPRAPRSRRNPAIAEAGLKGFDRPNGSGMLVPASHRREVTAKLNAEVARILKLPELRSASPTTGMTVLAGTPEQFAGFSRVRRRIHPLFIETAGSRALSESRDE